jgi:type I restriction enzyme M protein
VVSLDKIKENDYNLNVSLYVFPEEEEEEIDIVKEWEELNKTDEERKMIENNLKEYLRGLVK